MDREESRQEKYISKPRQIMNFGIGTIAVYAFLNLSWGCLPTTLNRVFNGMSKSQIEYARENDTPAPIHFFFNDFSIPGRELTYLILGEGEE